MIALLVGAAVLAQVSPPQVPPPIPMATKSFDALAFECATPNGNKKDAFSGHFGAMEVQPGRAAMPKVDLVVDADSTNRFSGSNTALSIDGANYWTDFIPYDLRNWRLKFSFGAPDLKGAREGVAEITSYVGWNSLESTEHWTCVGRRLAKA